MGAKTKGVVAAGHPESANAGRRILEGGGNAIDAIIATAFAACVAEPCLIALGSGGFMLVHDAKKGGRTLLDFFVAMPGQGLDPKQKVADLVPAPVDFGGTIQMFHAGAASIGVPGFVAGMFEAHRRFGTLPMKELVAPAQELAKRGVVVNKQQSFIFEILYNIVSLTEDSKKMYSKNGKRLQEGDTLYMPDIVTTLDTLAAEGAQSFYQGDIAQGIVTEAAKGGGLLTKQDMAGYEVIERQPVGLQYRGYDIASNPPPSSGGALITHTLRLLSHFKLGKQPWHSSEHIRHLVEAMTATAEVRKARFDEHVHDEDVLERLLAEEMLQSDRHSMTNRLGNTTHMSVIDAQGNAVSMTCSNGEGSGITLPGTGIQLNNILGEEDLNPKGFHQHAVGVRLPSMMSPTLVLQDDEPVLAVGSAGSNRIRSSILQVTSALLDFELDIQQAVEEPRVHFEAGQVDLEGGISTEVAAELTKAGYQVNLWKEKNLFFGGAQAVARDPKTGELTGAGDSRRGGVAVAVKA